MDNVAGDMHGKLRMRAKRKLAHELREHTSQRVSCCSRGGFARRKLDVEENGFFLIIEIAVSLSFCRGRNTS